MIPLKFKKILEISFLLAFFNRLFAQLRRSNADSLSLRDAARFPIF